MFEAVDGLEIKVKWKEQKTTPRQMEPLSP